MAFIDGPVDPVDVVATLAIRGTVDGRRAANLETAELMNAIQEYVEKNWNGWIVADSVAQIMEPEDGSD